MAAVLNGQNGRTLAQLAADEPLAKSAVQKAQCSQIFPRAPRDLIEDVAAGKVGLTLAFDVVPMVGPAKEA